MNFHEKIKEQLNATFIPGKDYFESRANYEKEILTGVPWQTTPYHLWQLDKYCPYKQGQLTTIVGHTNVGKTTFVLFALTKLIGKKKLIIYSAENRISQIARMILQFKFGLDVPWQKNPHVFDWLAENVLFIKHVKQFTYRDMLEQMSISDDIGFNADMIFIDPYNALKVNRGTHQEHYEAIEDMRIFTQTTGKSIFLNCHTVTEAQRVKPNPEGVIPMPLMGDVEGGGKFPNKSDDVWVVHRNLYHINTDQRKITKVVIGKVRNTDGGGCPTGFITPLEFTWKSWAEFTEPGNPANGRDFTEQGRRPE